MKVKDFIYNISDILAVVLIILAAVLIIGWRVDAIMKYPQTIQAELAESAGQPAAEEGAASGDSEDAGAGGESQTAAQSVTVTVVQNYTVTAIAQKLLAAGAISDVQQFVDAVNAAGAATSLKFGTYTIPAGSTPAQIVQMMI